MTSKPFQFEPAKLLALLWVTLFLCGCGGESKEEQIQRGMENVFPQRWHLNPGPSVRMVS